jgi:hypothetical protein
VEQGKSERFSHFFTVSQSSRLSAIMFLKYVFKSQLLEKSDGKNPNLIGYSVIYGINHDKRVAHDLTLKSKTFQLC